MKDSYFCDEFSEIELLGDATILAAVIAIGVLAIYLLYQSARCATHVGDSRIGLNVIHHGKRKEVCHGSAGTASG